MLAKNKIAILIVIYNGKPYIRDCVESLRRQSCNDFDIIIVDNNSEDDSVLFIRRKYPDIVLIEAKTNLGYAGGNNLGLKYILDNSYQYVMLLNEDTIVDERLLEVLLPYVDEVTVASPAIYYDRRGRKKWYYGGEMDWERGKSINVSTEQIDHVREVTFVTGCCILMHIDVLKKIGFFDEKYYLYYEDNDLCMRMLINQIKMSNVTDVWVWHRVDYRQKSAYYIYYMTRNRLYFLRKYRKYFAISPCKAIWDYINQYWIIAKPNDLKNRKYVLLGIIDYMLGKMYKRSIKKLGNKT